MKAYLLRIIRLPTVILGVVNLLALYLLVDQLRQGFDTPILNTQPRSVVFASPILTVPTRSTNFFSVQADALFYESRRFYVISTVEVKPPQPDYRLTGTLVIPNKPTVALLTQNQTGAQLKVRRGENLEGWTVSSVEPKRVVLNLAEEQIDIPLATGGSRGGAAGAGTMQANTASNSLVPPNGVKVLGGMTGRSGVASVGSPNLVGRPPAASRVLRP